VKTLSNHHDYHGASYQFVTFGWWDLKAFLFVKNRKDKKGGAKVIGVIYLTSKYLYFMLDVMYLSLLDSWRRAYLIVTSQITKICWKN